MIVFASCNVADETQHGSTPAAPFSSQEKNNYSFEKSPKAQIKKERKDENSKLSRKTINTSADVSSRSGVRFGVTSLSADS